MDYTLFILTFVSVSLPNLAVKPIALAMGNKALKKIF